MIACDSWSITLRVLSSDGVSEYAVTATEHGHPIECECKGFQYNGNCRHQRIFAEKVCLWSGEGPEGAPCPKCGRGTHSVIEPPQGEEEPF